VLGLQGDVREHARVLAENGYEPRLVLGPTDLDGIEGLVLPGGESTTQAMLLESSGLRAPLAKLLGEGIKKKTERTNKIKNNYKKKI
jgi:5'-phosphate synthase pdxT subunit